VRDTIILTVFNRPVPVLLNVLRSLRGNDLTDSEVLIVNDGSDLDYTEVRAYLGNYEVPYKWLDYDTMKEYPDSANFDGHNNPAAANNMALQEAAGDHITFLSSDCIIPPTTMDKARAHPEAMWVPRVVDMHSAIMWLCRQRFYPMCWFVRAPAGAVEEYDIEYLKGMAFEDNDWTARTALNTGQVVLDESCMIYHQSHAQVAYTQEDGKVPAVPVANKEFLVNEAYTIKKWGGIPWSPVNDPLHKRFVRNGPLFEIPVRRKNVA
jgi:hypothetical protein